MAKSSLSKADRTSLEFAAASCLLFLALLVFASGDLWLPSERRERLRHHRHKNCSRQTCDFCSFCCSSQTVRCYSRTRTVSKHMDAHFEHYDFLLNVVVFMPQKPQIISMLLLDFKTVKHPLDVRHNCYKLLSEAKQNSQ